MKDQYIYKNMLLTEKTLNKEEVIKLELMLKDILCREFNYSLRSLDIYFSQTYK